MRLNKYTFLEVPSRISIQYKRLKEKNSLLNRGNEGFLLLSLIRNFHSLSSHTHTLFLNTFSRFALLSSGFSIKNSVTCSMYTTSKLSTLHRMTSLFEHLKFPNYPVFIFTKIFRTVYNILFIYFPLKNPSCFICTDDGEKLRDIQKKNTYNSTVKIKSHSKFTVSVRATVVF